MEGSKQHTLFPYDGTGLKWKHIRCRFGPMLTLSYIATFPTQTSFMSPINIANSHLVVSNHFEGKSCQIKWIHDKTELITGFF